MSYPELVQELASQLPSDKPVYVGYSGGLDSSLLLHLACDAVKGQPVVAIHCNHGLSPNANSWQQFCESQASKLKAQLVVEHLVFPEGFSEAAGRNARYQVFANHLAEGAVLLLGHHADDQVETLLFRLFRGTGLRGLVGMPAQRKFARGVLMRPLMAIGKSQIVQMAQEQGIEWIEDESNQDDEYDRNHIRQRLIPAILKRWPKATASINRTAGFLREDLILLDEFADELLVGVDYHQDNYQDNYQGALASLDLLLLSKLPDRQQSLVLRRFLSLSLGYLPEALNIEEVLSQFLTAKPDAEPLYLLGKTELRRFGSRLFLLNAIEELNEPERRWDARAPLVLANGTLSLVAGEPGDFIVRFRSGGERLKPEGRQHSQTLKKLMQEYRIEPWVRDRIPLIYQGDQLIAVGDRIFCTGHRFEWISN